jgi:hypothetical protein
MSARKVKWGVLGVASIATRKVIPGMQKGAWSEIWAIASRDAAKAARAAGELGIARSYGSYQELLEDPRSKPSTTRSRTISTCPGRSKPRAAASTSCAKSRSP